MARNVRIIRKCKPGSILHANLHTANPNLVVSIPCYIRNTFLKTLGGLGDLHTRDSRGRRGSGKRTMLQGEDTSSEYGMEQTAKIEITIAPSLLNHYIENLGGKNSNTRPEDAITQLIATILNNSEFPVEARQTGDREIRIGYHLRSFSQPIFWE